jgi:hypothetical protein
MSVSIESGQGIPLPLPKPRHFAHAYKHAASRYWHAPVPYRRARTDLPGPALKVASHACTYTKLVRDGYAKFPAVLLQLSEHGLDVNYSSVKYALRAIRIDMLNSSS